MTERRKNKNTAEMNTFRVDKEIEKEPRNVVKMWHDIETLRLSSCSDQATNVRFIIIDFTNIVVIFHG